MKTLVISYSLTGNNGLLASSLAKAIKADHASVVEPEPRTMGRTALDMLFGRTPRATAPAKEAEGCELLVFVAPVWMGKAASPLRAAFKALKGRAYAFVSISGGADGPGSNPGLARDLEKRLGKAPLALVDLHITELLPQDPAPTRADTSAYRVGNGDLDALTGRALAGLRAAGVAV